ncbi:hypothetical protein I79_002603 [Cricetulus griseus]|uniref:Uncharacterized protein n=1 Tax=Cricetulus griseus TaxID=10029 RepID=G3GXV9_CRIGR|nr:hypothetical protein I79_002603 [Cricetulus griseus]
MKGICPFLIGWFQPAKTRQAEGLRKDTELGSLSPHLTAAWRQHDSASTCHLHWALSQKRDQVWR